jgi:hypothetical protein
VPKAQNAELFAPECNDAVEYWNSVSSSLTELSPEDKKKALESVLRSRTFTRSEQLRAFLRYVCHLEMAGRGDEISEYRIAVEALGRPQNYTTAEDSAVRSRAHALRGKLEEFYTNEMPHAPVRIEMIKGSYRPSFAARTPEMEVSPAPQPLLAPPSPPVAEPAVSARARVSPRWFFTLLGAACLAAAFAAGMWTRGFFARPDSIVAEAWGPLLQPDGNVLISVASHSHMQVRARTRQPDPIESAVEAPVQVNDWYRKYFRLRSDQKLYLMFVDTSTRFGDAIGASEVFQTIAKYRGSSQVFPERVVTEAMFRNRNVVLIGMPENSSIADRLLSGGGFQVAFDEAIHREIIIGPLRGPGAQKTYVTGRNGSDLVESHALITVLPGEGDGGSLHRMLILSGSHSSCTIGAAEFFSSASHLRELLQLFRREGYAGFPSAYQVVVGCTADSVLPLSVRYESHFVLKSR